MGYSSSSFSASSMSVLALVVLLFCSSTQLSSAQVTTDLSSPSPAGAASKVNLSLYYETLCPGCSDFMVNYLPQIFENGLIDIIDLKFIPYGNAKISADKVITCQHGPKECLLNTVEACALHVWPALDKHFSFIRCVETFVYNDQQSQWKSCYSKLGYEEEPINDCIKSGLGKKLELGHGKVTGDLKPPLEYVPWVTVNNEPLINEYSNFQTYVCNAYKGTKPSACQGANGYITPEAKSNQMLEVSFKNETTPTTKIMSPTTKARRLMKF
ncbi:hypothetical protein MKW94_004125 [Papaver nudicaule]|uniref:Gamma-interferon-inducible lysosomal thiol reductase n=1 Tax=Papaver nudicaule TaxID=74823 RepID=A0AA41RTA7_PAPNU|nr:hypothetical protein [Papaver nudicaule]